MLATMKLIRDQANPRQNRPESLLELVDFTGLNRLLTSAIDWLSCAP